ncbi:OmpW/AlkL family protein [Ancylobacter sp.]|uniref:OmpW/AlkL family protein n=1 Tax=Ancylobacter sp. TaxID=1872567 RepID=UPI003D0AB216
MPSIRLTSRRVSAPAVGLALLGAALAGAPARAADMTRTPPLAYKAPAPVVEQSPWQIRLRLLGVLPEDGGSVRGVNGSNLDYSDSVVPELDITYYFTKNWAAELILGVTPHDISGAGTLKSLDKIAEVWLLPPTLTLQYHFTDLGAFKPYVGAGINYTFFFDQKAYSADSIDVKDTFGWALQAGFDYMLDEHWGLNVDVKKLFLKPDFDVVVAGQKLTGTADLDPWIVGVGVTYRF